MSYANEIRTRVAYASAAIGVLLLLPSVFFDSAWSAYGSMLGGVLLLMGLLMCSSLSLLNGIPWLLKLGARHAEPVWEGNFIRTDGGQFRIRYVFDNKGSPWFIAQDVCVAVGEKAPRKNESKRHNALLLKHADHISFSETGVQAYLRALAVENHAANRLLVKIQNEVLRQLNKRRQESRLVEF